MKYLRWYPFYVHDDNVHYYNKIILSFYVRMGMMIVLVLLFIQVQNAFMHFAKCMEICIGDPIE